MASFFENEASSYAGRKAVTAVAVHLLRLVCQMVGVHSHHEQIYGECAKLAVKRGAKRFIFTVLPTVEIHHLALLKQPTAELEAKLKRNWVSAKLRH